MWRAAAALVVATLSAGCAGDGDDQVDVSAVTAAVTPPGAASAEATTPPSADPGVLEPELRRELLAMMDEDQAEQTGQVSTDNYTARTDRLAEILDTYGWPSHELVGEDGSTAAWVIAQHADLDLDLQQQALRLLRVAAAAGQASRGDLAYLEDRVAVATGQDQQYGTQMGCGEDKTPVPATPIDDPESVDERRVEAGLAPLADYVAEMTAVCAEAG